MCVCLVLLFLGSASKAASRKRSSKSSKSSRQVSAKEPMTSLPSEEPSLKADSGLSDAATDVDGDLDVTLKAVGSGVDMEITTKGAIHILTCMEACTHVKTSGV